MFSVDGQEDFIWRQINTKVCLEELLKRGAEVIIMPEQGGSVARCGDFCIK